MSRDKSTYMKDGLHTMLTDLFGGYPNQDSMRRYPFNYLDISKTDCTRVVGISKNKSGIGYWPSQEDYVKHGTFLRPGKLIKSAYPDVSDDKLSRMGEKLARKLLAESNLMYELKLSDNPSMVYGMNHSRSGSTGGSCMRGLEKEYFEVFDVVDSTKILYLYDDDNGYLRARALLHDVVYSDIGQIKFMDRVYTDNQNIEMAFFKWAKENGYHYKSQQSADCLKGVMSPDGKFIEVRMNIPLPGRKFRMLPYTDTFIYVNSMDELANYRGDDGYADVLNCTEGGSQTGFLCLTRLGWCTHCSLPIYEGDDHEKLGRYLFCTAHVDLYRLCECCGYSQIADNFKTVAYGHGDEKEMCSDCVTRTRTCDGCGIISTKHVIIRKDGESDKYFCEQKCVGELLQRCNNHGDYSMKGEECPTCVRLEEDRFEVERILQLVESSGVVIKDWEHQTAECMLGRFEFCVNLEGSLLRLSHRNSFGYYSTEINDWNSDDFIISTVLDSIKRFAGNRGESDLLSSEAPSEAPPVEERTIRRATRVLNTQSIQEAYYGDFSLSVDNARAALEVLSQQTRSMRSAGEDMPTAVWIDEEV